jgi:hypothetical protein
MALITSSFIIYSYINTSAKSYIYFSKRIGGAWEFGENSKGGAMLKSWGTTDLDLSPLALWSVVGIMTVFEQSWPSEGEVSLKLIKTKLPGFGPRANYTDRATAACWRS